jgi:hypothetical protein
MASNYCSSEGGREIFGSVNETQGRHCTLLVGTEPHTMVAAWMTVLVIVCLLLSVWQTPPEIGE